MDFLRKRDREMTRGMRSRLVPSTGRDDYKGREIDDRDGTVKVVGGTTPINNGLYVWLVTYLKRKDLYSVLIYGNREGCGKNQ